MNGERVCDKTPLPRAAVVSDGEASVFFRGRLRNVATADACPSRYGRIVIDGRSV